MIGGGGEKKGHGGFQEQQWGGIEAGQRRGNSRISKAYDSNAVMIKTYEAVSESCEEDTSLKIKED